MKTLKKLITLLKLEADDLTIKQNSNWLEFEARIIMDGRCYYGTGPSLSVAIKQLVENIEHDYKIEKKGEYECVIKLK